jgi:hypothetical protein
VKLKSEIDSVERSKPVTIIEKSVLIKINNEIGTDDRSKKVLSG